jgi:hypothetical protein
MATALPYPVDQAGVSSKANTWLLRLFPSLTDIAFLLPLWWLFSGLTSTNVLLSDGDTGWHIRTGDWILQHGQVPHQDIFSFTKAGQPWFAWEWGWDVLASLVHAQWGLPGIVLANALIVGLMSAFLFRLVRRHMRNHFLALGISMLATLASSVHWLARPHLLAWLFVLVFLDVIDRYERTQRNHLWILPPLMLLWTNLHGSFFIGIVFLLTYALVEGAQYLLAARQNDPRKPLTYLLCAAACGVVTFVNPYGWHLQQHVISYLLDSKQLNSINEFSSVNFHDRSMRLYELFVFLGLCAAIHSFKRGRWACGAMVILWTHLSLCIVRNIPIYLFISAPMIAASFDDVLKDAGRNAVAKWIRTSTSWLRSFGSEFAQFEKAARIPLVSAMGVCIAAVLAGVVPSHSVLAADFDPKLFPVKAVPILEEYSDARIFTHDQWGDYLIYKLYPRYRVFVDGRSDFYGMTFGSGWINTICARFDWQTDLSKYSINTVLARTSDPIASVLKLKPEWTPVFDDGTAIVFRRKAPKVSSGVTSGGKTCNLNCLQVTTT